MTMTRQPDPRSRADDLTEEKIPELARSEVARILAHLAIGRYLRLTRESQDDRHSSNPD